MTHHWVTRVLLLVAGFMQIHANPSISTSTPTPCYGDVVTLVCHHPELASSPDKYFSARPQWRKDGVKVAPSTSIYLQDDTSEDHTRTTLNITITVDYFRNRSFDYSCLLALAENGRPTGEVESSENVTVDPVEPQPLSDIQNNTSLDTSIAFNWTHTPVECYKNRISYNVSWVNINNNAESGFNITGGHMYNITGLVANGNYTISVQAVVDGNVQSTAVSKNLTTGLPNKPHNIRFTEGVDNIHVSWEHEDSCFVDPWFSVTWKKPGDNSSTGFTVNNTTYNITGLIPYTNYNICISAVSASDKQVKSTERCWSRKTTEPPPTKAGNNAATIAGPVGGGVTITVVTLIACML